MEDKILIVDDDVNLLAAFRRQIHHQYVVDIAIGGDEALDSIKRSGPYAVVVSDLMMPGMDGIRLLSRIKDMAPETVRILLTGHADLQTAIDAVNEGSVFRFLTKPCSPEVMIKVLTAGMTQYRLITAEKELLEKTLSGSIKVLTDVLSLVNPAAFGRANRIHRLVRLIVHQMKLPNAWEIEMAALLSQLGCVTVPESVVRKLFDGETLAIEERAMVEAHPQIGHDLIVNIPRLEGVAKAIAYQDKRIDGSGLPADNLKGAAIPMGARILKTVLDFDALETKGRSNREAIAELKERPDWYDRDIVRALDDALILLEAGNRFLLKEVRVDQLMCNMIVAEDIFSVRGLLLVSKGQDVTVPILLRLRNFICNSAVCEPIKVLIALDEKS